MRNWISQDKENLLLLILPSLLRLGLEQFYHGEAPNGPSNRNLIRHCLSSRQQEDSGEIALKIENALFCRVNTNWIRDINFLVLH